MTLYSPGGLNLADTTAPLILAFDDTGTTDVVFAVSASGDLTITPDGGGITFASDVKIPGAKKLYLDGGSDTYLEQAVADVITVTCGGTGALQIKPTQIGIPALAKFYLDGIGGGDTYIVENSANVLRCVSGGSGGVDLLSGGTSWTAVSDERLKTIIEPISDALAGVGRLRSVIGRFNDDARDRRRSFLIAQDVQKVLPEAVTEGEDGILKLSYTDVIPLLVAAINELEAEVVRVRAA